MEHADIGPISWVNDDRDLVALCVAIETASEIVFDLETTGLDEHAYTGGHSNGGVAARVSLASFTLPQADDNGDWDGKEPTTWVLPLSHPDSAWLGRWRATLKYLAEVMVKTKLTTVGHNVKFDCRWVYAMTGVDLTSLPLWDTRISSHLLDETQSTRLKERAPATFGIPPWDDHDLSYPGASEDVPLMELGEYAARDTYWTWKLYVAHRTQMFLTPDADEPVVSDEVQDARLGRLATRVAMPTISSLTKIEQRGMVLDLDWVDSRLSTEMEVSKLSLDSLCEKYEMDRDKASTAPTSHWFRDLTEKAVDAGDLVIANLTPSGKPQWTKAVLEKQARAGSEAAELILQTRNATKRAEFLRAWKGYRTKRGLVHSTYNAGSVVTGRLSSSEPNMQQVTKALKPAFIPRDGFVLAEIDYSQIELRVAAHISRCEPMIEAFNRGDDLHRLLAARITRKSPEDVTPEERQLGKSANFGLLYGMGAYGFQIYAETAYGVDMTMEDAVAAHEAFFDQWEGMRQWHVAASNRVKRRGEVVSPIGRVRRLPEAQSGDEKTVAAAERNAINSPVQGFASDLMQMAAASIGGVLPGFDPVDGAYVVGTVHDSIVVELAESTWQWSLDQCIDRMTRGLEKPLAEMECEFSVPIVAEATVGTRWGIDDVKGGN